MKPTHLLLALILASCAPTVEDPGFEGPGLLEGTDPVTAADLKCTLSSPKASWKAGEKVELHVRIQNNSPRTIALIGALDASDNQWRYPHCSFERQSGEGLWTPVTSGPRCGNTNDLRVEDFVTLETGDSLDPYTTIDGGGFFETRAHRAEFWSEPGEYRLRFFYSTLTDDDSKFRGDLNAGGKLDAEVRYFLKRVPRLELHSNELTIHIEP